jgi:hypothetical protein
VSRKQKAIIGALLLLLAIAATTFGLVHRFWPHHPPGIPPELVPASWEQYRTSPGHMTHVEGGKATCTDCHDYTREGFKDPGSAPCARCHAKEAAKSHHGDVATKTECLTCHVFAPDKVAPTCISCHATMQGASAGVSVHATTPCASCHQLHETPSIVATSCTGCHQERAVEHARHVGTKGCLDCHSGHGPASTALTSCASCHARASGPQPPGHDTCFGCHAPHEFATNVNVCANCHAGKATLVATQVEAHATCTNCHAPHAPAQAAASCANCHTNVHVTHDGHDACVECHEPHGPNADNKVVDTCTSCHKNVASSDTSAHAKGVACRECHAPHDFPIPDRKTLCVNCHASETTLAGGSKGHNDCTSCHGASTHKPIAAPTCGSCHQAEQSTAPPGHQKCVECHEPHAGTILPRAASCASCHAEQAKSEHASVQGGCNTCHRPHGPSGVASPPVCTTCHATAQLPALHAAPAHSNCASCHSAHEPPRADRVTCTGSCHADKRDHQPQAQVCSGCHVFRH